MAWADMVYQDKAQDIPETVPDGASLLAESDKSVDIPGFYRATPAVLEAQRILRGKSTSRPITDGRVIR